MIGIAVVGYGYWGPNLVRNFSETPGARLVSVCDLRKERLVDDAGAAIPPSRSPTISMKFLRDPRVDAIAIATPVSPISASL